MSSRPLPAGAHDAAGLQATSTGRRVAWGLAAALALANAAGYAFDLYARFWWFDRVLHAATVFALTYWAAVFVLRRVLTGIGRHRLLLGAAVACVGVAVGAWWEVAEWAFDRVAPGDVIKGKYDTIIDLVMDTLGAALAAWMGLRALRPAGAPDEGRGMKHAARYGVSRAWLLGVWDRVRTSFWLVPSLMALGTGAFSYATVALDRRLGPEALEAGWVWSGGADGARSVLSTIAGSMATVAGVVFSVNIVALTLASSEFGPRLLRNFTRDLGNQLVLGTFISTFLYALLVLRSVRSTDEGVFIPQISVTCAVLLAVASVGLLIYFIGHVAEAIQVESLIAAVGEELQQDIVRRYGEGPAHDAGAPGAELPPEADTTRGTALAVRAETGGYVQGIALDELADAAADFGAVIRVLYRPGDFVLTGEVLALVHGAARPPGEDDAARVRRAFGLGPRRTPMQDVHHGARQLTEIAVRALSTDDATTAMGCMDWLGEALAELARRTPEPAGHYTDGALRVWARPVGFAELAETAFTPLRIHGAADPAVAVYLIRTLTRIGGAGGEADRAVLLRLAEQTAEDATRRAENEVDRGRIADALTRARAALGPDGSSPGPG